MSATGQLHVHCHLLKSNTPFSASLVLDLLTAQNLSGNGVLLMSVPKNHPRMHQKSPFVAPFQGLKPGEYGWSTT